MRLILASASAGRKHILNQLNIPFDIIPSKIDEDSIIGKTPLNSIQLRAKLKAEEMIKRIQYSVVSNQLKPITDNRPLTTDNQYLILTADTEVILNNVLIGKPNDYFDAVRILKLLSGNTHEVITAMSAIRISVMPNSFRHPKKILKQDGYQTVTRQVQDDKKDKTWQDYDKSLVTFRNLSREDIKLYLSLTEYTRYTGSYALVTSPNFLISKIEGSLSNVIGLPLEKLIPILRENNVIKL